MPLPLIAAAAAPAAAGAGAGAAGAGAGAGAGGAAALTSGQKVSEFISLGLKAQGNKQKKEKAQLQVSSGFTPRRLARDLEFFGHMDVGTIGDRPGIAGSSTLDI